MLDETPRRSPQATWGTPFSNFGKIVFVPLSPSIALTLKLSSVIHQALSTSMERQSCTQRAWISPMDHRLLSI